MRNQPVKSLHTGSYQLSKHCIALAAAMTIALASWQSHAAVSDFETDEYKAMGSLHLINASSAYDLGYTGKGIVIGLIDQIANANHSELSGKTTVFHGTRPDGTPAPWPQTPEEWSYQNHGTHVAGIAAGNRNGSLMHGVAFDSAIAAQQFNGAGEVFEWSEAFLKTENLRVINNSWSRGQWVDPDKFDLYGWKAKEGDFDVEKVDDAVADMRAGFLNENDAITRLIRWAQSDIGKKGVVVFSAGNGGVSDVALPGLAPRYFGSTLANWITVVNADNRFTHLEKDSGQGQGTIVIDPAGVPVTTGMAGVGKLYTVMAPGNWINSADASDVDGLMRQGGNLDGSSPCVRGYCGCGASLSLDDRQAIGRHHFDDCQQQYPTAQSDRNV